MAVLARRSSTYTVIMASNAEISEAFLAARVDLFEMLISDGCGCLCLIRLTLLLTFTKQLSTQSEPEVSSHRRHFDNRVSYISEDATFVTLQSYLS
jgi:hypothetical protein